ncbi:MAG: hypothetical protein ACRYGL_14710 [Janthinobacterium lividum]
MTSSVARKSRRFQRCSRGVNAFQKSWLNAVRRTITGWPRELEVPVSPTGKWEAGTCPARICPVRSWTPLRVSTGSVASASGFFEIVWGQAGRPQALPECRRMLPAMGGKRGELGALRLGESRIAEQGGPAEPVEQRGKRCGPVVRDWRPGDPLEAAGHVRKMVHGVCRRSRGRVCALKEWTGIHSLLFPTHAHCHVR